MHLGLHAIIECFILHKMAYANNARLRCQKISDRRKLDIKMQNTAKAFLFLILSYTEKRAKKEEVK